jgi:hypothetical protein
VVEIEACAYGGGGVVMVGGENSGSGDGGHLCGSV